MLELRSVSKRYRRVVALDALSLRVDDREVLAVMGPSGAGKSTLLRVIAGLERPDAGTVLINGRDAARDPPHARGPALVPQDDALYPHLSARDNIALPLRRRGTPRREALARAEALAEALRIGPESRRRPGELSGGQRRRVSIARALAARPSICLLDEPLSALDEATREALRIELRERLREAGTTAIIVTHDAADAAALADRTVELRAGRVGVAIAVSPR